MTTAPTAQQEAEMMKVQPEALRLETVKAGRGAKVHYRFPGHVQTLCGQGMGSRGGRMSMLYRVTAQADCAKCKEAA